KAELTKRIAEIARGLCLKIDAMNGLLHEELFEYFTEMDELDDVLYDLLEIPPGDIPRDIIGDYTHGRIEYDDMLAQLQIAKDTFDPVGYAEFERMYEEDYGVKPL